MVKIGHARNDENGRTDGPLAGDQTGKEILVQDWYERTGGWDVYLECTDEALADRAASFMEAVCANPAYGYSQKNRWAGYRSAKHNGVNGGAGDFDCSSLCLSCYILAGLDHAAEGYTGSMEKSLSATGRFKAYRDAAHVKAPDLAKRGGLYLTAGKHVAMVLTDGNGEAATGPEHAAGTCVEIVGGRVNIRAGGSTDYRLLCTASRGDRFPLLKTAWYPLVLPDGTVGFVSNKSSLTRLTEDAAEEQHE